MKIKINDGGLSEKVAELLVEQMAEELYNHNLYMTFANYFKTKGLEDLVSYFQLRGLEEYEHHRWIADYLNENLVSYTYPAIDDVAESIEDDITPFELTVEVELDTTKGIYEILDAAIEAHDYKTVAWLNAEGKLIQEQIEEEHVSKVILEIAKQEDSWISKASAIRAAYEKIS